MTDTLVHKPETFSLRRPRPTREQAEDAVRTLLSWAGDDPDRDGLALTPKRVAEAFGEYFKGYRDNPIAILREGAMDDVGGYDEMVLLRGIPFTSHCEHHMAPFTGKAHVAYIPAGLVAGLSRLSRLVDAFACRLQTQEMLTAQICDALVEGLAPRGVAVLIEAEHQCIAARGVRQHGLTAVTQRFWGSYADDPGQRDRFISLTRG